MQRMWCRVLGALGDRLRVAGRVEGLHEGRARVTRMRRLRWGFAVWESLSVGIGWDAWRKTRTQFLRKYLGDSDVLMGMLNDPVDESGMPSITCSRGKRGHAHEWMVSVATIRKHEESVDREALTAHLGGLLDEAEAIARDLGYAP